MTTIKDLIAREQRAKEATLGRFNATSARMAELQAKQPGGLTPEQEREVVALRNERTSLDSKLLAHERQLGRYEAEAEHDNHLTELARESHPGAERPAYDEVVRTGAEQRMYGPRDPNRHDQPDWIADVVRAQLMGDPGAGERLQRHAREVEVSQRGMLERAVSSGGAGAFVPPQYLVEAYAELARAGRPTANLCYGMRLPSEGVSFNVPRVTTGTTTAVQASENATVSNTDFDETTLTVPLVTIAGYNDVSRQALDRGQTFSEVIFADLSADYNAKLDAQVLNGSGTSGQHTGVRTVAGINAVSYTDASPTVAELWPKLADAVQRVQSNRFAGPSAFVMHPRRWAWMLSAVDSQGRPFVVPGGNGPNNAAGLAATPGYGTGQGDLFGLPVVTDANIPTNLGGGTEDVILVAAWRDVFLMEEGDGSPVQLRAEQPLASSLGVRLVVWGYSALAAGRQPTSVTTISGSGLAAPAF